MEEKLAVLLLVCTKNKCIFFLIQLLGHFLAPIFKNQYMTVQDLSLTHKLLAIFRVWVSSMAAKVSTVSQPDFFAHDPLDYPFDRRVIWRKTFCYFQDVLDLLRCPNVIFVWKTNYYFFDEKEALNSGILCRFRLSFSSFYCLPIPFW